jgi:RNA recognition motif-containing protein
MKIMRLFVGQIRGISERELRDIFAVYGCTEATIVTDPHTGRSRGFGFVNVVDGEKAILALHNQAHAGRKLQVEEARQR